MHIAYLALDYPRKNSGGGVGTIVQTLARSFVASGHKVTVVVILNPGETLQTWDDEGVRVIGFRPLQFSWYISKIPMIGGWFALPFREFERSWSAWRVLRQENRNRGFDLIEITETAGLVSAFFLRGIPIVARLHGEQYTYCNYTPGLPLSVGVRLSRLIQRSALRRCVLLISPSKAHAREIRNEFGVHSPPIEIVPNTFYLPKTETQTRSHKPEPIVLFAGRLERHKGVLLIIKAAAVVIQKRSDVQFVFAGANHPSLKNEVLDQLIQDSGLSDHILLLGHLRRADLFKWYQKAVLCVLPSYYETFGIAALEPMAFGLPVISTTAGALPEVIEDGKTGILVPPGDVQALAKAILSLLTDQAKARQMGNQGKVRAQTYFDIDSVVERSIELYRRVIQNQ